MSNPSNLYAEKIYAEHPTALWSLDDKLDYISLITESQREIFDGWSVTGAVASSGTSVLDEPFKDSVTTILEGDIPSTTIEYITCISPDIINFTDLEQSLSSFCLGSYFYSNTTYLASVQIGYEYTDTTTSEVVQVLNNFDTTIYQQWGFVSGTFDIPNENTNLRIVLKIGLYQGGISTDEYQVYINGLSFGQWSEEFNAISLGVTPQSFPLNINLDTDAQVISAPAYGLSSDYGYYLSIDKLLLAKNTSVPLVFGASNVTKLLPNPELNPSLIIPGKGFLNESGRHKEYTVEFWARITSDTMDAKRIFGPINSSDGLYVEGGFLTLVIGNTFRSHFVGEWFRPMLIHIRIIRNSVSMLINGEEVVSFLIETDSLVLPTSDPSEDWLGFYSYEDVTPVEIDCIAIYPYQVPITVAKRRWVYGQGVISPEGINGAYGGVSSFIDYPFADYTSNYSYPDFAQWQQGTFDNLATTSNYLTTPQYSLPEIFLDTKTTNEFYSDCKTIQSETNKFITFRPNESWDSLNTYINFPRFNILTDEVHSIFGVFKIKEDNLSEQILFKIYNSNTGNYFSIRKDGPNIDYYLYYNGIEEEFYSIESFPVNELISIGVNFKKIIESFGGNIASFFGNQNGLKMYVGGDETGLLSFTGNIYTVGISNNFNSNQIENHFTSDGFVIFDSGQELIDHTASYTLLPIEAYSQFFLDIGVSGYWEDYMPLSYFAQYVTNDVGNQYYDLDFLQFNIKYPSPSKLVAGQSSGSWSYEDLFNEYTNPVQKTYSQLDNFLFSGWNNYQQMSDRVIDYYEYDTANASIRSFITFQYIVDGANLSQDSFTETVSPKLSSILDANDYSNWEVTKFEVVDNTIIYPRVDVDFNEIAIVYHLDFNVRGILSKPVLLKNLEVASQAFNDNSFNPIGTRFGISLFPYKKSGIYYDYKAKNPFSIYKGSTPYLYLTRTSGIEVRGEFDPLIDRGISMPINQANADNYRVSAMQMWMRYDYDSFPGTETKLFDIRYKDETINFYLVASNNFGNRAKIFAKKESDNSEYNGITYYINGTLVRQPEISLKEWSVLSIAFGKALVFDSYIGSINLNGPATFNNISYYQANNLQQIQSVTTRPWLKVKEDGPSSYDWSFWVNNYTWDGVLVISQSELYGVNPVDVYKTYLGTNKIIIDDSEGVEFNPDKIKVYNNSIWTSSVTIPV